MFWGTRSKKWGSGNTYVYYNLSGPFHAAGRFRGLLLLCVVCGVRRLCFRR